MQGTKLIMDGSLEESNMCKNEKKMHLYFTVALIKIMIPKGRGKIILYQFSCPFRKLKITI